MINRLLIIPLIFVFLFFFFTLFYFLFSFSSFFSFSKQENFTPIQTAFSDYPNNIEYSDYKKQLYSDSNLGSGTFHVSDMSGNPISLPPDHSSNDVRYDPNKYDVAYHLDNPKNEFYDSVSNIQVLDSKGNLIKLPYAKSQNLPVYFDTEKYPYGLPKRVPNYLESVILESS